MTYEEHADAIEAHVKEAALDTQLPEDVVWHDVTVAYLITEVDDLTMRVQLARGHGIPLDMVGFPMGVV